MTSNVAVVGLDDFNQRYLTDHLRDAEEIRFHGILSREEVTVNGMNFSFEERLELARQRMAELPGGADGIITYWDFPPNVLTAFLARDFDLPYASVDSVMKCEHKLWSRHEQETVAETPAYCGFYPFDDDPLADITLDFPFWIKPVIGHSSMLGFQIEDEGDFRDALEEIRTHIRELGRPFRYAIEHANLPPELAGRGASLCLAEEIISAGDQYTLEGYVRDGEVVVYGVIDSIRTENEHTFSHYQYPSRLDAEVIEKMADVTRRVMRRFGYGNCPFNIEFFFNAETGNFRILEINSRISQSHSDLFLKVDGQPNQQISVDLALGREPRWRHRAGAYPMAAKFFLRKFEDARVTSIPDDAMLAALQREMPNVRVDVHVAPGQHLAEMSEQESYSYDIADLHIGGKNEDELHAKFEACKNLLRFTYEPVNGS